MAEVLGHGGLRSDTEERYAALKVRLKEADIGTPLQTVTTVTDRYIWAPRRHAVCGRYIWCRRVACHVAVEGADGVGRGRCTS
jgi:hypothetical protein